MIVKAEIFQDKALLLDRMGRVWQVEIGPEGISSFRVLEELHPGAVSKLLEPALARYMK